MIAWFDRTQAITSYHQALIDLEQSLTSPSASARRANPDVAATVRHVLLTRDRLAQHVSATSDLTPAELDTITRCDEQMKKRANDIERLIGQPTLIAWRETRQPPDTAWWWFLDERAMPYLTWSIVSAACLLIALVITIDSAVLFLQSGTDLMALLQVVIPLLIGTTFTRFGQHSINAMLGRIQSWFPWQSLHISKTILAVILLVLVSVFRYALIPTVVADYFNTRGVALTAQGKHAEAAHHFQRAISLNPAHTQAYYNLGTSYEDMYNYEQAIAVYQQALEYDDQAYYAYNNLARILMITHHDYDQALSLLERGIAATPADKEKTALPVLYANRGWAYLGLHLPAQAYDDVLSVLATQPDNAKASCLLAQVLEQSPDLAQYRQPGGVPTEARAAWQKCLDLWEADSTEERGVVEDAWIATARERLTSLSDQE